MISEITGQLENGIIPFWSGLKDEEYGGFYGYLSFDLKLDKKAVKGSILNSRILWFYSNAYLKLKDSKLLELADHAYDFMTKHCLDREAGGVYWSVTYDGKPADTMKHTYNQAFAVYALSSYYAASGRREALERALEIFDTIETKCRDDYGYMEAFDRNFKEIDNDALSENGVMAHKTMNTVLHVMEAYTELYRVSQDERVKEKLCEILDTLREKIFNPELTRLEVFFDEKYNPIIDLHSYGHDIEASWLIDRAVETLKLPDYEQKMGIISRALADKIYKRAFDGHSLLNECERGKDNTHRIWWVQAEGVLGFVNAYQHTGDVKYLKAAENIWDYIKEYIVDKRPGSEWFWEVDENGSPIGDHGIVEQWKCPYHNGRMCLELMERLK